jgi:hypothetical protein
MDMNFTEKKIETRSHPIRSTYSVGKTVVDEAGNSVIVREDRAVCVNISTVDGDVFHRGARIA